MPAATYLRVVRAGDLDAAVVVIEQPQPHLGRHVLDRVDVVLGIGRERVGADRDVARLAHGGRDLGAREPSALAGLGALVDLDLDVAHAAQIGGVDAEVPARRLQALPRHVLVAARAGSARPRPTRSSTSPALPSMRATRKSSDAAPSEMLAWLTGPCQIGSRNPKPDEHQPPPRGSRRTRDRRRRARRAPPCARAPPCSCAVQLDAPLAALGVARHEPQRARRRRARARAREPGSSVDLEAAAARRPRTSSSAAPSARRRAASTSRAPAATAPGRMKPRGTASET